MDAPPLWASKGDPRQPAPMPNNVVKPVVFAEGIERRFRLEEYFSVCRLGTARFQVVDQGLTDLAAQRQTQRLVRLPLNDFYCRIHPPKVVQFQRTNIPSAQSQPACQQKNGVISFPFRRTAINRTKKSDHEFLIP